MTFKEFIQFWLNYLHFWIRGYHTVGFNWYLQKGNDILRPEKEIVIGIEDWWELGKQ